MILLQIGRPDGRQDDLALAPGLAARYRDDGVYVPGRADAVRDWPCLHPGPLDAWAGRRTHTFRMYFDLRAVGRSETGQLSSGTGRTDRKAALSVLDMCITCLYAHSMSRMIQVRNVPRALHATLKARAALAGQSLSDYLVQELKRVAERPTRTELLARLATRKPVRPRASPVRAVRAERDRS